VGRSLFFRTAATLALAFIVFQAAAFWVVYRTLIVPVAQRSADDLAGLIVLSTQTWVELPPATRPAFERELAHRHGLRLSSAPLAATVAAPRFPFRHAIESALSRRIGAAVTLAGVPGSNAVWLTVPVGGRVLAVGFFPDRYAVKLPAAAIAVVAVGALLTLLTALLLVRRITVPLAAAARAAGQVGAGELPEPLPETGPRELAELARRFNRMATEVRELLDNRTTLLAGISHDLRTPLTRLTLNLEMLRDAPSPARIDRALGDLAAMNRLVEAYLELARTTRAPRTGRFDVAALLEAVAREADIPWHATAPCPVTGDALAARQILVNLIGNAQRHGGEGGVTLALECDPDWVRVWVRDRGPGIPEDQLEKVFRPFYRVDDSRSAAGGGTGLGLAIVRQLAAANGWRVTLENRPGGGLAACVAIRRGPTPA
jgi:two-component system osmolarity sensor histidine kinase EnvZ